jgi:hypothetical protein
MIMEALYITSKSSSILSQESPLLAGQPYIILVSDILSMQLKRKNPQSSITVVNLEVIHCGHYLPVPQVSGQLVKSS